MIRGLGPTKEEKLSRSIATALIKALVRLENATNVEPDLFEEDLLAVARQTGKKGVIEVASAIVAYYYN